MFAVRLGLLFAIVLTALYPSARDSLTLTIMTTIEGVDAIWDTALRVLFTDIGRQHGAGEGQVLGIIGFLQTVIAVVGPVVFQSIYAATVTVNPGFVFFVVSGTTLVGFIGTLGMEWKGAPDKHELSVPLLGDVSA